MTKKEKVTFTATPPARPAPEAFLETLPGGALPDPATALQDAAKATAPKKAAKVPAAPKNAPAARQSVLTVDLTGIAPPPLPGKGKPQSLTRLAVDVPTALHDKIKDVASRPGGSIRDDITKILTWYYLQGAKP